MADNNVRISLSLSPSILEYIDSVAKDFGIPRGSAISVMAMQYKNYDEALKNVSKFNSLFTKETIELALLGDGSLTPEPK